MFDKKLSPAAITAICVGFIFGICLLAAYISSTDPDTVARIQRQQEIKEMVWQQEHPTADPKFSNQRAEYASKLETDLRVQGYNIDVICGYPDNDPLFIKGHDAKIVSAVLLSHKNWASTLHMLKFTEVVFEGPDWYREDFKVRY